MRLITLSPMLSRITRLILTASIILMSGLVFGGCTNLLDRKNVGGLQVISNGTTSSLFLDGQYLDKTPFINKSLKPGTYTLKIEPENNQLASYETQLTVRKGLLTVVTWKPGDRPETSGGIIYELEPIPGSKGEISFVTIPDNAIVVVDNNPQQYSPTTISDVAPGLHQFEIRLPSYEEQQHSINIINGHRVTVTAKLAKTSSAIEDTQTTDDSSFENAQQSSESATKTASEASSSAPLATPSATPVGGARAASQSAQLTNTSSGSVVTITPTNYFQDGKEVVRIRDVPNMNGFELGVAEVGETFSYLGKTENDWYNIFFKGQSGWVSREYANLHE